ncbi:hypothetical protein EAF04_009396 [Stromatinia cepivora]|nr:hypothetical protein EAF04_009396 [Stromatinia cepivora]
MTEILRRRLLLDIAELQAKPYPNIYLHVDDENLNRACLILTVEGYGPLHMNIEFPIDYPIQPPIIEMDSAISHPNIFKGGYICASILNTTEGWTPAYTLKGIAIQLLSFFASDAIEQVNGRGRVYLHDYRAESEAADGTRNFFCAKCGSGREISETSDIAIRDGSSMMDLDTVDFHNTFSRSSNNPLGASIQISTLPDEVVLLICDNLDTEDLMLFAKAWSRVGHMVTRYDLIRTRELQCFLSKQTYKMARLGVGVGITREGGQKVTFSSEFDLVSHEAFWTHHVRRSVQGIKFQYWLPLPISEGHWKNVQSSADWNLKLIRKAAGLGYIPPFKVIYHFMNDVMVKFNKDASGNTKSTSSDPNAETIKSTLTHASEKAIESYFHLFHLLICLAIDDPSIVESANDMIHKFIHGETSKSSCPNLGHLLIASLISNVEVSYETMEAMIKEAITRNVVWMLGEQPGLSYIEPSEVSHYRLEKTFEAGKTSYRILMFLNLFKTTAVGNPRKPLSQLANEAFKRHGAPPRGSARILADCIKRIHLIDSFPDFFGAMGMGVRQDSWFTNLLRECIKDSINKGYSKMPITQSQALYLRQLDERDVDVVDGLQPVFTDMSRVMSLFHGIANDSHGNGHG